MKIRQDFVTNSSSSSFIITNKSSKTLTGADIAKVMEREFENFIKEFGRWRNTTYSFEDFIDDAESSNIVLEPNETMTIECGDGSEDGIFENVIHYESDVYKEDFEIEFYESHH